MPQPTTKKSSKKKAAPAKAVPAVKKVAVKKIAKKATAPQFSEKDMLGRFFLGELKDIYWAEKHLAKVLVKMEKSATASGLKKAFTDHRKVTEGHIGRLEKVFTLLNEKAVAKKCEAMAGITKEGDEIISDTRAGSETRDVGLIFAAQKVEHYEIATYGSLAELARTLNLKGVPAILEATLAEEKEADMALTALAKRNINKDASQEQGNPPGILDKVLEFIG